MNLKIKDFEFRDQDVMLDEIAEDANAGVFYVPLKPPFDVYIDCPFTPLVRSIIIVWGEKDESIMIIRVVIPAGGNAFSEEEWLQSWPISDTNYIRIEKMLKENGYV